MHGLKETNAQGNIKLCSFDITNTYSNIPQKELIQVIDNALQNNINTDQKREVILLINTILNQDHIQRNNHQYKQEEGLPMGVPHLHSLPKYSCNT
jgi:hypothetical protein